LPGVAGGGGSPKRQARGRRGHGLTSPGGGGLWCGQLEQLLSRPRSGAGRGREAGAEGAGRRGEGCQRAVHEPAVQLLIAHWTSKIKVAQMYTEGAERGGARGLWGAMLLDSVMSSQDYESRCQRRREHPVRLHGRSAARQPAQFTTYSQMSGEGLDPSTFMLRKFYPSYCFQFASLSVEFQAQAVGVWTILSSPPNQYYTVPV
jgi:hypothetical protein